MELTVNLNPSEWYTETPDNALSYWGLDYPPLSAYQSYIYGRLIGMVEPEAIALHSSRGYETASLKRSMRWSVLISDALFFLPPAFLCTLLVPKAKRLALLSSLIMAPALMLIDHGHFQYNSISLGLSAGGMAAVGLGREVVGTILFCLSMNHKQMSLYYAPAFFGYILGKCLQRPGLLRKAVALSQVGVALILTMVLVWGQFILNHTSLSVVQRIFPVQRGLYEDYVANFWCVSSLLIKWRSLFSQQALVKACIGLTLVTITPSMVSQIMRPSRRGFLLAMAVSSLSFFMFSYHVHEKSILLPLMPLGVVIAPEYPLAWAGVASVGALSMYPLLKRDGIEVAYSALLILHSVLFIAMAKGRRSKEKALSALLTFGVAVVIPIMEATIPPPQKLPHIWDAAIVSMSAVVFSILYIWTYWQQWIEFQKRKAKKIKFA